MNVFNNSPAIKRFQHSPWPFQASFQTPLKDLDRFVSTFLSAHRPIDGGCVTIDGYVFEPKTLNAFLAQYSLSEQSTHGITFEAENQTELEALLRATLADWIDFLFISRPKAFAIYADHDEYTTFYANRRGNLSKIVQAMRKAEYNQVNEYERTFR